MSKFFHRFIQVCGLGIAMVLILLLFCGYADEAAALPEGELSEAGSSEADLPEAECPDTDCPDAEPGQPSEAEEAAGEAGCCSAETEEAQPGSETASPKQEEEALPEGSPAEPSSAPTPMPMFDIIDGRTIFLSITEEEFIEIAGILRDGLDVNDAALAGVLGNLQGESGFDPHKVGDDGGAFGICQWRGARLDQMVEYCEENDLNPVSLEGQLSFLIHDLVNNYVYAYDQIRHCEDSESGALQATYNFCAYYEVPADPEAESAEREEWTKLLIYPKLNELSAAD